MRRMALNLARVTQSKKNRWMRPMLKMAAWDDSFPLMLIRSAAKLEPEARKPRVQKR